MKVYIQNETDKPINISFRQGRELSVVLTLEPGDAKGVLVQDEDCIYIDEVLEREDK